MLKTQRSPLPFLLQLQTHQLSFQVNSDTDGDSIVLGGSVDYNEKVKPRGEWYYSDNLNGLTFENDKYLIIINQE
ncbi:MAG: hypothetical protein R3182_04825, partial [Draconibacterium sp.]|nr:hypothetical protein [Draconibacterium sp.]